MPLPVIAGVARVTAVGLVDGGGRWSNTWHFRREDLATPDSGQMAALSVILEAFYASVVIGQATPGTTLEKIDCTPLDGTSGAFSFSFPLNGTTIGNALPAECAECLTLRTALRGRQNRGRIFLPAIAASSLNSDGQLAPTVSAAIVTAAGVMDTAAGVAGWETVVASYGVSYKTNYTVTPKVSVATTWTPHATRVTAFTMDNRLDVIRHRKS